MTNKEYTEEFNRRVEKAFEMLVYNMGRKYLIADDFQFTKSCVEKEMKKEFPGCTLLE